MSGLKRAAALMGLLAACAGEDPITTTQPLNLPCTQFNEVMRQFGATLRAGSPFVLGAYVQTKDGVSSFERPIDPSTGVSAPGCSLQVTSNLKSLCEQEFNRGPCGNPGDFDACLAAVELALTTDCSVCGNGICELQEASLNFVEGQGTWINQCPADCECGNATCQPDKGENIFSCPTDCPAACGDGFCSGYEVCGACEDLPYTPPPDCRTCDADCCRGTCGDGLCAADTGETRENCEQDCSLGFCGDRVCLGGESERTCLDCFNGWESHCLNEDCREGGVCADDRERCGDGLCMGCEQWTCATDCEKAGHLPCLTGSGTCPAGSCGDGKCEHPVENGITCPVDCLRPGDAPISACDEYALLHTPAMCVGDSEFVRCGDGFCSRAETVTSCAEDCQVKAGQCSAVGTPDSTGKLCAYVNVDGPVTGTPSRRSAIVSALRCDVTELCRDACAVIGGRATCVDCGWIHGELENLPCTDTSARCIDGQSASLCIDDPANPGLAECRIRRAVSCRGGCANEVCVDPALDFCANGACGTCGDGRCDQQETVGNCPGDCSCRAACYFTGVDRDEVECPPAFAACNCGDRVCRPWERSGEWACMADCGGT